MIVTNPEDPAGPKDPPEPDPPFFHKRIKKCVVINRTHFEVGEEYDVTADELVTLRSLGAVED